ncbi:MAG: hypothetical protein JXJ20_01775 [Anaerolineae bacterium]|nr:hypothetical protein [Anaerolineae bacterium]
MHRTRLLPVLLCLCALVAIMTVPVLPDAAAQNGPDGYTSYQLNMRTGPGPAYDVVAVIPAGTGLIFEAHNADMSWLLGHTEDGAHRGWVSCLYLTYRTGFAAMRLPASDEVLSAPAPPAAPQTAADAPAAPAADTVPPGTNAALDALPLVSGVGARAREIYLRGQALGNNPRGISKVGECNSMSYAYLMPFALGSYNLGTYGDLQATVDFFGASSFGRVSAATGAGYTAATVIDPAWANPSVCGGLSPLECEYERAHPSVAMIMLGMHDVHFIDAGQYEQAMRRIIEISIDRGVIPVLSTFPIWPDDDVRTANRYQFNQILVNLSREYGVPLMNFWRAANDVPHSGVGVDHVHLTERGDNWTAFDGEEYQWGMTMWNLVALQMLDALRLNVMY